MAIIVVLAAVALPTFGRQLETARETSDLEVIRAAYTEALPLAILDANDGKMDGKNGNVTFSTTTTDPVYTVTSTEDTSQKYTVLLSTMPTSVMKQTGDTWQYVDPTVGGQVVPTVISSGKSVTGFSFEFEVTTGGNVALKSGGITIEFST